MRFSSLVGPLLSTSDKDEEEISKLSALVRNFTTFFNETYGKVFSNQLDNSLVESAVCTLLYYTFTSGAGLQTLGEEVNLLVLHRQEKIPGLLIRTLYVLLQVFGTHKFLEMLSKLYSVAGANVVKQLKLPLSLLAMHGGSVLSQYVLGLKNYRLKKPVTLYPFYLIVLTDVLYVLVELYKRNTRHTTPMDMSTPVTVTSRTTITCTVCIGRIAAGQVTASPCGHVGCWECLNRTAQVKPACPICNGPILPLLALRNIISQPS